MQEQRNGIQAHRKFLLLITRGLEDDDASSANDGETHPVGDTLSRLWYANDRRDAILAGHDSAMRHRPTHFHHQATGSEEEGCPARVGRGRSEEHSSELQSPYDLVCRLLLEKKK